MLTVIGEELVLTSSCQLDSHLAELGSTRTLISNQQCVRKRHENRSVYLKCLLNDAVEDDDTDRF